MYILQLKVILNKICCIRKNYGKINEQVNQMEFKMSKLFLTQHLNQVFTHMEKRDSIKAERSAIKENEVFKLRQEAVAKEVAKERIAQDQPRQERIIQEQTTLRVEQERIALEKLTLKAEQTTLRVEQERNNLEKLTLKTEQEALQKRQEMLTQIKDGILSVRVSIQQKLQEEREQLDKEKAEHERVINTIILNEANEMKVEEDYCIVPMLGYDDNSSD